MFQKDSWLLPEGIEEVLPAEAWRLEMMRRRLLDLFYTWGYELVMPPTIEFLESLLTGTGEDLDLQTFKITDQLSGRLMGLRADITPQVARIDAHYLKRKSPARLCYVGPVLHTRPDEFAGPRELLQLGAELFGHAGAESDGEVLQLMLAVLALCGLENIHLDLGHVGVFRALAADAQLSGNLESELFDALQRKARPEIDALLAGSSAPAEKKKRLAALVDLNGDDSVLKQARDLLQPSGKAALQALDNLETVAQLIKTSHPQLPRYFDLAELRGYHYYTGVVFSAFIPGQGQAVAQGGRYDGIGAAFGRARAATGFSTDLRALVTRMPLPAAYGKGVLAPHSQDTSLQEAVRRLRAAGERVVMCLPEGDFNAVELGCDRKLVLRSQDWVVEAL